MKIVLEMREVGRQLFTLEVDVEDPCQHRKRYCSELAGCQPVANRRYNHRGSGSTDVLCRDWPPDVVGGRLAIEGNGVYVNSWRREVHPPIGFHPLLWGLPVLLYAVKGSVDAT